MHWSTGHFLVSFCGSAYFATRSLESEEPIELNTLSVWLAEVTRKNLAASLAQYCSTAEVGSPGEPVLTCTV